MYILGNRNQWAGWWKEIINSSFPCFVLIPSFLYQKSQCILKKKKKKVSQRDPDSPAFILCIPVLANDSVQCQDPACLSINLIDSACHTCQGAFSQNSSHIWANWKEWGQESLITIAPSSLGEQSASLTVGDYVKNSRKNNLEETHMQRGHASQDRQ